MNADAFDHDAARKAIKKCIPRTIDTKDNFEHAIFYQWMIKIKGWDTPNIVPGHLVFIEQPSASDPRTKYKLMMIFCVNTLNRTWKLLSIDNDDMVIPCDQKHYPHMFNAPLQLLEYYFVTNKLTAKEPQLSVEQAAAIFLNMKEAHKKEVVEKIELYDNDSE